jgi:nicotinamidase-related amidase
MSSDYKVLVVVDLQNCFIQGGSLGSMVIKDLKKYIELVKEIDLKISENNYDLVVFSKDSHPLNHSSLFDKTIAQYGVYIYHCRNSTNNCIKDKNTYMSSVGKDKIRDILCDNKNITEKKNFYDIKEQYKDGEYNFYNKQFKQTFTDLLVAEGNKAMVTEVMNDINFDINNDNIITLENLIKKYIDDPNLEEDSKMYLEGILDTDIYKNLNVQGLDLNYLFYNTTTLKDIIYALNTNNDSEIGIKGNIGIGNNKKFININDTPNYDDKVYNVDNIIEYKPNNKTKYITITKGQYCDYESYSAFNYHIKIKKEHLKTKSIIYDVFKKYDNSLNVLEKLPAEKKYSTGLFEYILKDFKKQNHGNTSKQNIEIDVCGLVTNICVINTVHQGIAMWEKVYKSEAGQNITCKFNLLEYLSIPLAIDDPDNTYFNYNYTQQINKEEDLNKRSLQLTNLETLFTTKFEEDVVKTNTAINKEKSYTVDYNIEQGGGNRLKYKHNKLIRNKVKKYDNVVYIAPKKAHKKEILGKERCIYKKSGDRKEYLKHKGCLITVSEYKKLMKSKKSK